MEISMLALPGKSWAVVQRVRRLPSCVVQPTKRRVYVMFDNKGDAYHWSGVSQVKLVSMVDVKKVARVTEKVTDGAEAIPDTYNVHS
ncbi:hypothetical protein Tco_0702198 [Tanacetum coccineum]|uniref:Uncharacterized protein n=1 Tax=Tanacetum coccineum TaxID=301880 RepID=A0ABQ4XX44_9ASTR